MEHRATLAVEGIAEADTWADRLRTGFAEERPMLDAYVSVRDGLLLALMVMDVDTVGEAAEEARYAFTDAAAAADLPPARIVSFTVLAVVHDEGGPPDG